jgi:hypothetical protein
MLSAVITIALVVVTVGAYFVNDLIQKRRELDGLVRYIFPITSNNNNLDAKLWLSSTGVIHPRQPQQALAKVHSLSIC